MAVVVSGQVEIVQRAPEGDVVLRLLEAGAVVGELASDGRARTASVRTRTPVKLIRIPSPAFRSLLKQKPELLETLYWLQLEQVRNLTRETDRRRRAAIVDPLTGLLNYSYFRERLELEVHRARQTGEPVALVMLGIDGLREVNEAEGEASGNSVLRLVAEALKPVVARGDILCRYGGAHFAVLMYGVTRAAAIEFGERARAAVAGREVALSGGVALFPDDVVDADGLVRVANLSLFQAKDAGGSRIQG